jgi:SprT protein
METTLPVQTSTVEGINELQAYQELLTLTMQWWDKFNYVFKANYPYPKIETSLTGLIAGRACFQINIIQYNLSYFAAYRDRFISRTIPHEIAHFFEFHYLLNKGIVSHDKTNNRYGIKKEYMKTCLKHGKIWKNIMRIMGLETTARNNYSRITSSPYVYKCSCREHGISKILHGKILRGIIYRCKHCQALLVFAYAKEV